MPLSDGPILATVADAPAIAELLDAFNTEFDVASPGVEVLCQRLDELLGGDRVFAVVDARPPRAVAVVSLRPNVWFDGPVALLDELYVQPQHRSAGIGTALLAAVREEAQTRGVEHIEINVDEGDVDARRFYERNGFTAVDVDSGEAALYYSGPARWSPGDLG
jgi:GNAT superfamily N-acetyltransferase